MAKAMPEIDSAAEDLYAARRAFDDAVNAACPIGSIVEYEVRYGVMAMGEVVDECNMGSIWVRNLKTGKSYRIDPRIISQNNGVYPAQPLETTK